MIEGLDHGIPWTFNTMVWCFGIPLAYFGLCHLFRQMKLFPGVARKGSDLNDVMAFEFVAGFCVVYLSMSGCYCLFNINNNGIVAALNSGDNRVYNSSDFIQDNLAIPMMFFQGWNLLLCFWCADLRDLTMIIHHLLVTILAYMGCAPYIHLEAVFFFGVAELTNIPLTMIDIFKYLPWLRQTYPWLYDLTRTAFAILFIILRLITWPMQCWNFWMSSGVLICRHYGFEAESIFASMLSYKITVAPHSILVVVFFVAANLMLTALQYFWGVTIFGFLLTKKKKEKTVKQE